MIETYKDPVSPDQIRRQIIAWHEYHDLGEVPDDCFRKPVAGDHLPQGVSWVFSYEETVLFSVFNAYCDDADELQNSFDKLMEAHGYWYEHLHCCSMMLYPIDVDWL